LLAAAGVLVGVVWTGWPDFVELAWIQLPDEFRRRTASLYLDALLVGYGLALVGSIGLILVGLALRRLSRGDAPGRRQARLLALGVAILLSLLALDVGAAAWSAWQRRMPRLPEFAGLPDGVQPAGAEPVPAPAVVPAPPPGTLTILVIGESSARGEPYQPWLSVGQIAAWKLESVFLGRPIRVDIRASGGLTIKLAHDQLAGLVYRPDAMIVFLGHNEFATRFPWMREPGGYYEDDMPVLYSPAALRSMLRLSPMCRLALETWDRNRIDLRPPHSATRELVDQPIYLAGEYAAILADFGPRLEAIAAYTETIGTLPIFIVPASNDGGYDPSRSVLAPETPRAEREAFAREVARARALEETDPAGALRLDRELVSRHPEFAESQYRLARLLERRGDWEEARRHYVAARERDGMPLRCPEDFRRAYGEVAARHPSVLLVDGPKVLEAVSEHGILDDRLFHDAQHPNLRGYAALAQDLLDQLHARRAFGWREGTIPPSIDVEDCARHFALDANRWAEICRREAGFYDVTAYIRYDPTFRLTRAADYRRAREAILSGRDPAEAGIPAWGKTPMTSPPPGSASAPASSTGRLPPGEPVTPTRSVNPARPPVPLGSRPPAPGPRADLGTPGPAVDRLRIGTPPAARPGTVRISKKIWRAPENS
jgi:tetratricopeptide (TPR) repeat protein